MGIIFSSTSARVQESDGQGWSEGCETTTQSSSGDKQLALTSSRRIKKQRRSNAKVFTISLHNNRREIVERVSDAIVGEVVQVFWPHMNFWVDVEVLAYTSTTSATAHAGMHCIQYEDGIKEWKKLTHFRVVERKEHASSMSSDSAEWRKDVEGQAADEPGRK